MNVYIIATYLCCCMTTLENHANHILDDIHFVISELQKNACTDTNSWSNTLITSLSGRKEVG